MAEKQIGRITHFYDHISVGVVELTGNLKVGDKIHIQGTHDDLEEEVESRRLEHENIKRPKKGQAIAIKVSQPVHDNDKIFKVEE